MSASQHFTMLEYHEALQRMARHPVTTLLTGGMGTGKSTLAARLAQTLATTGQRVRCIGADPGTPAFGVPGAVCLGEWQAGAWQMLALEPLCSLDAGRFRLPLTQAVARLVACAGESLLLIDSPGMVRGEAGAETLSALAAATGAVRVILLAREPERPPLAGELAALGIEIWLVEASAAARRPGKRQRDRGRTRRWDAYLATAGTATIRLDETALTGMPPPQSVPSAWIGRQAGLKLPDGAVMGEILALEDGSLTVRAQQLRGVPRQVLVRDARRDDSGLLVTAKPFGRQSLHWMPARDIAPADRATGPRPVARVGPLTATLVNGVFGDPLLHLRLLHRRRSLLFDLGETVRLPAKVIHQVTDVFVSHAHADHIGGFLSFLRTRIGEYGECQLFGPPGLAYNIEGLVRGIHWDRAGVRAPRFRVAELHGERIKRYRVVAGEPGPEPIGDRDAEGGVLIEETEFRVRAATLDHGTPVLAFAFEPPRQLNVRRERLADLGLAPGPWLTELKRRIAGHDRAARIELPDGTGRPAGELADALLMITPGQKLAYATDLADTAANRERLAALARHAHTFFCEAPFLSEDAGQARRTGHLTARACGEIATAAGVARLVPFHFSARYEGDPERVYREVRAACVQTVTPGPGELQR